MNLINICILIVIGLAGGLAVGGGFVAFLTVLDIVPRLCQLTKTYRYIYVYQVSIIMGAICWIWIGFQDIHFKLSALLTIIYGLFAGIFIGMLAAALTEILNVLPILARRINVEHKIILLLLAMILGKVLGSLYQWIFFVPSPL